jgi:acyl-CoA reductase-like NAD-dependent aldehyde dehydrogenase
VHEGIASDFLAAFDARAKKVVVGDPLDEATRVGAIITPAHLLNIQNAVEDAGANGGTVRFGGAAIASSAGQYMAPTVVTGVHPDMAIARNEVFGPVLSVLEFSRLEEAVRLVDETDYGLSAGIWSRDFDTTMIVARAVRTGTVWVNTFMDGYPELPFGGMKQSGIGRELGKNAVEDYSETKTIQFHRGPRTAWWVGN